MWVGIRPWYLKTRRCCFGTPTFSPSDSGKISAPNSKVFARRMDGLGPSLPPSPSFAGGCSSMACWSPRSGLGEAGELHGHCVQVVWTWAASWYSTTTGNLMVEPKATKDLGHHWHFPWHIRPFGTMHIRTWICPRICSMHGTYWYIVRTQHSKSVHQASLRGIHVWIL